MKIRKKIIAWLFDKSQTIYVRYFKKKKLPWGITVSQLLEMKADTFGNHLGVFLKGNGFELLPKVERHDAYHVLTGFGTKVEDEIALQYMCFGNGKRSPYLLGVLLLGTLILPEYLPFYLEAYRLGKLSHSFHHFDYKKVLVVNYNEFRDTLFTDTIQSDLAHLHATDSKLRIQIKTT